MNAKSIVKRTAPHLAWIVVCAGILVFSGASDTNKDSLPLTRNSFAKVAEKTLPAVVSLSIRQGFTEEETTKAGPQGLPDLPEEFKDFKDFWEFFRFNRPYIPEEWLEQDDDGRLWLPMAGGSGVIIRSDGYIVSNRHVVLPAIDNEKLDIEVKLQDGRQFSRDKKNLQIVAVDDLRDLAVLKIDASGLPALKWGDSDAMAIGDWVLAVGNPLDLEGTASEGIISQKHRKINKALMEDLLQITAMINPGNSGGALVNLDGELVGINMAIASNTGRWQGVGFAIPSNVAQWVTDSIIKHGKLLQGYMGVGMSPETNTRMSKQTAKYYKLPEPKGVLIDEAKEGGPAAKGGLQKGDVIVELKVGKETFPIENNQDLLEAVASQPVDTKAQVTYYRDGQKRTTTVTLVERPSFEQLKEEMKSPEERKGGVSELGLTLQEITEPIAGVRIMKIAEKSAAAKAEPIRLQPGDVITEVDDVPVKTPDDVRRILKEKGVEGQHRIKFTRQNREAVTYVAP